MKTLVVSDWHIGNPYSNEHDASIFLKKYLLKSDAEEVILNGDIIDLLCPNPLKSSVTTLLNYVMPLLVDKDVVYIVGNHEYELSKYNFDLFNMKEVGFEGNIKFTYPFYRKTVEGKEFLFTHGHLFDKSKKIIKNGEVVDFNEPLDSLAEIEEKISSIYDFLFKMPKGQNDNAILAYLLKRTRENIPMKILDEFIRIKPEDVEEIIDKDIKKWFQGKIDCLVCGHWHEPQITLREGEKPKVIANSGAFMNEPVSYQNTWLEIDEDIKLYRWKEGKSEELKKLKISDI